MTDDLAERLIDAQVAFSKRQLLDPGLFHTFVTEEVDGALRDASGLTLGEVVTPRMIKDTAIKFAVNMPLEGSIPELVGEIAGRLYRHPVNDAVHLTDVLDTRTFDELADAIGDMDVVRRVVREVIDSPVTVDVCVEVVTHAVDSAVLQGRSASEAGVRGLLAGALARLATPVLPAIETGVEKLTRTGAAFVLRSAGEESDNALVGSAHELWRNRSDDSVGRFRELVTADDVEDFVVVIFEFWKSFRETEYFRTLLGEGVDHFFDKYGDTSLVDLISDLGVEREDLVEEGMRFGLPIIAHLDERGLLDGILRRQFVPFYHSPEFRAVIDDL
ncbi:MAG TPA: hypothetical protein PLC22_10540 [Gordonia sp. (in: high G+C Gram-positive bacteria)]|jgi:hypothetical protein|uniref:hypothetical protein n=1 Tax=Gordonia sp. (in: high G+C Gram-positive bacteria) TaxID=84139 RepID=UPI002B59A0FC|nr:hypothetical protein [Gordonia sp. (in: high G+C Gram-positive bacteria)]